MAISKISYNYTLFRALMLIILTSSTSSLGNASTSGTTSGLNGKQPHQLAVINNKYRMMLDRYCHFKDKESAETVQFLLGSTSYIAEMTRLFAGMKI